MYVIDYIMQILLASIKLILQNSENKIAQLRCL